MQIAYLNNSSEENIYLEVIELRSNTRQWNEEVMISAMMMISQEANASGVQYNRPIWPKDIK